MGLVQREIIQGEPIHVGESVIVPEAQVLSWKRRQGTIRLDGQAGHAFGFVAIRPHALLVSGPDGEQRITLQDATAKMLLGLAAGTVIVLFLAQVAERLARPRGGVQ